jgi:hypothetical protein
MAAPIGAGKLTITDNRIEIRKSILDDQPERQSTITEWYVNKPGGNTAIIGAPADDQAGQIFGSAYVFVGANRSDCGRVGLLRSLMAVSDQFAIGQGVPLSLGRLIRNVCPTKH